MHQNVEKIKRISTYKINYAARIVGYAIEHFGITDPKVIAEVFNMPLRSVYQGRSDFFAASADCAESAARCAQDVQPAAIAPQPAAIEQPSDVSAPYKEHARLKEQTSSVSYQPASKLPHEPEDDLLAGLNGSTAIILRDVVAWANMPERNAKNWLATTVSAYGPEVTKAAHQKLKTDLAGGSIISQPLATMSRIAQRLKSEGVGKPKAAKPFKPSRW